jgi:hypothetical protein
MEDRDALLFFLFSVDMYTQRQLKKESSVVVVVVVYNWMGI